MEILEIRTSRIIITFVILIGLILLLNFIIYQMASEICDKSEVRPIRYESQGLFGVLNPVETTPENADTYGKVCIKYGEIRLWSTLENIEYLIEKSQNKGSEG